MPPWPDRERLDHCPLWCEENVWRLLARPEFSERPSWALLVTNAGRSVALRAQRAGSGEEGFIVWDYHVLALAEGREASEAGRAGTGFLAFDLDSFLDFPLAAARYVDDSFPAGLPAAFAPRFRLVARDEWVEGLCSDRSHMRDARGNWKAPPPPWSPPAGRGSMARPNLMDWLDLEAPGPGVVLDRDGLLAFIGKGRTLR